MLRPTQLSNLVTGRGELDTFRLNVEGHSNTNMMIIEVGAYGGEGEKDMHVQPVSSSRN